MKELLTFIDYVHSFYGKGGLYDLGATKEEITLATAVYLKDLAQEPYDPDAVSRLTFAGDSVDRENVREVLLNEFSYKWPGVK